jgi:hypothetical protein
VADLIKLFFKLEHQRRHVKDVLLELFSQQLLVMVARKGIGDKVTNV